MSWYVVHTKPRQEERAIRNLEQQGYMCFLPTLSAERLRQGALSVSSEPLFPRYLFLEADASKSLAPIRSTPGVSCLVTFGGEPATTAPGLIEALRARMNDFQAPKPLFSAGERVLIATGAFAGLEAVYHMPDGQRRALVLIEILSKPSLLPVAPAQLRKLG